MNYTDFPFTEEEIEKLRKKGFEKHRKTVVLEKARVARGVRIVWGENLCPTGGIYGPFGFHPMITWHANTLELDVTSRIRLDLGLSPKCQGGRQDYQETEEESIPGW